MSLMILFASTLILTASGTSQFMFADEIRSKRQHEIEIKEGETIKITETNLVLQVKEIKRLESIGCLGGPVGCPVHVVLDVTNEKDSRKIRLAYLKNKKPVGIIVFDYEFSLVRVQEKQIVLQLNPLN